MNPPKDVVGFALIVLCLERSLDSTFLFGVFTSFINDPRTTSVC